ncbi:MAG TPA: hypothetical protein VEB21_05135 [Terriglobales bacterium]|nr:hypothetical protein [Terriglobales bacterium]
MPRGQVSAPDRKPTSPKTDKGSNKTLDRSFYRGRRIHEERSDYDPSEG